MKSSIVKESMIKQGPIEFKEGDIVTNTSGLMVLVTKPKPPSADNFSGVVIVSNGAHFVGYHSPAWFYPFFELVPTPLTIKFEA